MDDALEQAFHDDMLRIVEEAKRLDYNPTYFHRMVQEHGGVEAARRLSQGTTSGFRRLVELGRLDLTSEALMLRPEYASLFTAEELERARTRLAELSYRAPWDVEGEAVEEAQGEPGRRIPDASRDDLLAAMERFDAKERASDEWRGWEARESHRYAIEYAGRRYPVKHIIRLATGAMNFSGGAQANGYVRSRGFDVVRVHPGLEVDDPIALPPDRPLYDAAALDALIAKFEAEWRSFESEAYLDMERRYKVSAFEQSRDELSRERLDALVSEGDWEEAKRAIQRAAARTNLLNQWDTGPIRDAPAEPLVRRFRELVYGDGAFDERHNEWIALVREGSETAWPAATYFLMLFDPAEQIFVKATPFRALLKRLQSPLRWEGRPTAARYTPLRALAQALLEALRPLGARDMIDVQSFIWLMTREEGNGATPEAENETGAVDENVPEGSRAETAPPGAWIFQANPKYYDLTAALAALNEMSWTAPQHRNEIRAGDTAYLWESGTDAGIVAVATVIEAAKERGDEEESRPFYRVDAANLRAIQSRVWLRIDRVLDERITRDELQAHSILRELSILKFAQGTNFPVTPEQGAALAALLEGEEGRDEEGVEIEEAEVEAQGAHSRYIVESPEEWRRAVASDNPVILRAAADLPGWIEGSLGRRVVPRMSVHPGRPWIYLRAPDGRMLAGFELNRVRTIYVWVTELSESQRGELRATLANPASLLARPAFGSDTGWRFTIQTEGDYELARKVVGEVVHRLVPEAYNHDSAAGAEVESEADELSEPELEAGGRGRYMVESVDEWRRAVGSTNPLIQRAARELPTWVADRYGQRVTMLLNRHPSRPWLYLRAGDGRWLAGFELNWVRTIYVWVRELSDGQRAELGAKLSTPHSLRARPRLSSDTGWRFTISTAPDYELALKVVGEAVDRLVAPHGAWPERLDEPGFVVIHAQDNQFQHYGESYSFTNLAGGAHRQLSDAVEAWQRGGPSVHLIFYRPGPEYAFTGWARVIDVETSAGEKPDQQRWILRLEFHEFPVPLSLKGNAAALTVQLPWLAKGLGIAFRGFSIRPLPPTEFATIIEAAQRVAGESEMRSDDGSGPLMLRERPYSAAPLLGDANVWRIHFPFDQWPEARAAGAIGIRWDVDEKKNQSVRNFERIRPGDRVVVYVQQGRIGGIGVVSREPVDIRVEGDSGFPETLFDGDFPRRVHVTWSDDLTEPRSILNLLDPAEHTKLYNRLRNPVTIVPLPHEDYEALLALLDMDDPVGAEALVSFLPDAWPALADFRDFARSLGRQPYEGDALHDAALAFGRGFDGSTDADTLVEQLRQLRLILPDEAGLYEAAPYVSGDAGALLRLMALALLLPRDDGEGDYYLPSRTLLMRLRSSLSPQTAGALAPSLSPEDAERLLGWYGEAGLVVEDEQGWRLAEGALDPLSGEDMAATTLNDVLTALRNDATGAADDLPEPDQRPLRALTEEVRRERMAELARDLLIDEKVVRRIYRSLLAGRHVVLSGPPGTGKTELARRLPTLLWREAPQSFLRLTTDPESPPIEAREERREGYLPVLVTATEDWGVRDVVGGIAPRLDESDGKLGYSIQFGALTRTLLRHYQGTDGGRRLPMRGKGLTRQEVREDGRRYRGAWLVIDEFTRAPVDAAFGSLLTTLSGGEEAHLAVPLGDFREMPIPLPPDFRIIGTLNSFDRHFLNQMSEALKRRFDFIDVPPPPAALRRAEEGIAVQKALARLEGIGFDGLERGDEGALRWPGVLSVEVIDEESGRQFHARAESDEAKRALRSFERLFELIRLFRQLGTAQAIALFLNLFTGVRVGMGWEEALDSALADSLADQLQVLDRDAQRLLDLFLQHAGDAEAFAGSVNKLLMEMPPGRATAFRDTLTEGLSMATVSGVDLATRLRAEEPLALPRPSLFQRRLRDLMGERGL